MSEDEKVSTQIGYRYLGQSHILAIHILAKHLFWPQKFWPYTYFGPGHFGQTLVLPNTYSGVARYQILGGHTVNRDVRYGVHSNINLKIMGGHMPE